MTARRHPGRRRGAGAAGFALIEVLVSLTLLAVGLMAVLTAVLSALDLQKDAALRYRAGLILRDKLGETLLVPYAGEAVRGRSADGVFGWTIAAVPWSGGVGNGVPDTGDDAGRICEVVVDVSWRTTRGARHLRGTQLVTLERGAEVEP